MPARRTVGAPAPIERSPRHLDLLKFRALPDNVSAERAICSIVSSRFWCSRFVDLNDAMEGVYTTCDASMTRGVYEGKMQLVICSFSDLAALNNPLMWGYYANGFKGIAIHMRVSKSEESIKEISYQSDAPMTGTQRPRPKDLLHWKSDAWRHEHEFRYTHDARKPGLRKIGKVTSVIIGNPYHRLDNKGEIEREPSIVGFLDRATRVRDAAQSAGIDVYQATISRDGVQISRAESPGATV